MVKNALLEIRTEELPTSYIEPARKQMLALAGQLFKEQGLAYGQIQTYATPCRLALFIEGLAEKSEDRVEEFTGPAARIGRDAEGNFTQAAKGFAARHGMSAEELVVKKTDKGEYLCARRQIKGRKAEQLLVEDFPAIIGKLAFPKTMVWESSQFRFARPVRSIIALFGDKTVKFQVADVKSGNWTVGLHTLTAKKIVIKSPDQYLTVLRNQCVIADPEERKALLRKSIEAAARHTEGTVLWDEALVDEINYLVEHPTAILGRFDESYLRLPAEVLINCLKKKQKFFAINDTQGKLTNCFIGIRNGISENQEIVREGYERVLSARLSDAAFFFQQDTATTLFSKADKLKGVLFQEKLGSVYDKVVRMEQIALAIRSLLENRSKFFAEILQIERACALAKADLTTYMVFEYPELQGAVGRIYATHDGEPPAICTAIEEHYWPLTADGKLPETEMGAVLSLADKIDTVTGDFAAGLIPTGSQDPYGLRRSAAGILRILRERRLPIPLRTLVEKAFSLLPDKVRANAQAVDQVMDFLRQRLEALWESEGYRFDEIRAVLAAGLNDVVDADARIAALKEMRSQADFAALAGAFKRASNILRQAEKNKVSVPGLVNEQLFTEASEKDLYEGVRRMESEIQALLEKCDYRPALQKMVSVKPAVDAFFDNVMVMAEDQQVRANRLAILNYINKLFFKILDFSQLQG